MISMPDGHDLKQVADFNEPNCLTIYLPLDDFDNNSEAHRIQIKNLLSEAEIALLNSGLDELSVGHMLAPARSLLLEERTVWWMRHSSLVLFIHKKLFSYAYLPGWLVQRQLIISRGFFIEPLLNTIGEDRSYFVLALNHSHISIYRGSYASLVRIKIKDLPTNMHMALRIDEYPQSRQTHSVAPASSGKGSEAYHSQYNVAEVDKKMLQEFFRAIDKGLHHFLQKDNSPLILAGVDYLTAMYRRINTYPGLIAKGINGDFKQGDLDSLRNIAWNLLSGERP